MTTMVVEDVAMVAVIGLFIWLVPVRGNGIPGLRGRGRVPVRPRPAPVRTGDSAAATRPERVRPRPVPAAERISRTRDDARDARVLAELDRTWDAGYADRVAAELRDHRDSA